MQLQRIDGLLFIPVTIAHMGAAIELTAALIDTGSGGTIVSTDAVKHIGIEPRLDDVLHIIRGVGGRESVFFRTLDYLQIGNVKLPNWEVEIGGMDYGFNIQAIVGLDVLTKAGAIINLDIMEIDFHPRGQST